MLPMKPSPGFDSATVACGGFVGARIEADGRARAAVHASGTPYGLTLVYTRVKVTQRRGLNHLGYPGLIRRVIAGH